MKNTTRLAFNGYTARLATLNDVAGGDVRSTFSVDPTVQQTLEDKMQESSEFLKSINLIGRDEMEGEKIGLGVSGPVASRTDTTGDKRRKTRDASSMSSKGYRCEKTNFDTHITYAKLDAWAKFPDFQTRIANAILRRQALDRIMIGFNGVKVSADTNLAQYPLLQDVNKGWLQHLREDSPQRVMGLVGEGLPGKVIIGKGNGADYVNLDAAVYDAVTNLDPWYQDDTGLVVIVGRELLHDKYFPLVNKDQAPTEALAADIIVSQKRIGGLPAVRVPSFPPNAMLITRMDNLSIYFQNGGRRRRVVDAADADRIENYESSNDAYVIEDDGLAALVENIVLQDAAGGGA
ncbi:phage major capsid protein, P2 family [Herbaspirillum robiniae]|uniref:phage major capsid protein, P2 family n=1 Tax=Herbaspirillum robiniae TaxID=2014887 RepID=UPI0009A25160|nr:phage major capsid protein, P2 family [Herbaspirillum robiniae]